MSYQVLARRWRPKTFSELVGQEHVVRALSNALDNDRLHHAYLFTGTRGVGKTTIARILSKSLNCETGIGSQPCGECSDFDKIRAMVVLPTPRVPVNRYAWCNRSLSSALLSARTTCS